MSSGICKPLIITESIQKVACSHILHRFMGHAKATICHVFFWYRISNAKFKVYVWLRPSPTSRL